MLRYYEVKYYRKNNDSMPLSKISAATGVNFVVPMLGIVMFGLLYRWMNRAQIQSPPFLSYFILFTVFGGWLMVLLTAFFWKWSGMASLGLFYLMFVAPFLTAAFAWKLRNHRSLSAFHRSALVLSVGYSLVMFLLVLCWAWVAVFGR